MERTIRDDRWGGDAILARDLAQRAVALLDQSNKAGWTSKQHKAQLNGVCTELMGFLTESTVAARIVGEGESGVTICRTDPKIGGIIGYANEEFLVDLLTASSKPPVLWLKCGWTYIGGYNNKHWVEGYNGIGGMCTTNVDFIMEKLRVNLPYNSGNRWVTEVPYFENTPTIHNPEGGNWHIDSSRTLQPSDLVRHKELLGVFIEGVLKLT